MNTRSFKGKDVLQSLENWSKGGFVAPFDNSVLQSTPFYQQQSFYL
jgi:hypothetical protein